ncbi:MAG: hypothetical protein WCL30_03970 [Pseudomonadota bacterium]
MANKNRKSQGISGFAFEKDNARRGLLASTTYSICNFLSAFDGISISYPSMDRAKFLENVYRGPERDYLNFQSDMLSAMNAYERNKHVI